MDANIVVTQFTSAALVTWGIQKLKTAPWFPWLKNEGQTWLKRCISIAAAIGVHTGISAIWNANTAPVGYAYQLVINIPPIAIILVTLWHCLSQYVIQESWYQVVFNRGPGIPAVKSSAT